MTIDDSPRFIGNGLSWPGSLQMIRRWKQDTCAIREVVSGLVDSGGSRRTCCTLPACSGSSFAGAGGEAEKEFLGVKGYRELEVCIAG